jgi:hypothetical protein
MYAAGQHVKYRWKLRAKEGRERDVEGALAGLCPHGCQHLFFGCLVLALSMIEGSGDARTHVLLGLSMLI